MQVSVEKTSDLERKLTIEVPSDKIDEATKTRLAEVAKTAKVDGFRKGNVPEKILEKKYGESIRQEVLGDILQSSFVEAIIQEKIQPASRPDIDVSQFEAGKPLIYVATVEVYPEIKLVNLEGQEVEHFTSEVTEADIDKTVESLLKQSSEWKEVDRAAKDGDQVVVDFEGFFDDKPFDGGKAENTPLVLGSKSMIPGFEEGLVGMKKGEERDVTVTFPKDYHHKVYAGKPAVFKMKVNTVSEPVLPELTDEFIKNLGIQEGGIDKLRETLRTNMESRLKGNLEMKNKNAILDKLLELNNIEVPKALIEQEADALLKQSMTQFQHLPEEQKPKLDSAIFKDQAERRVKLGLLMAEVVKANDIKPNDDEVKVILEDIAKGQEKPEEFLKWYNEDKKRMAHFEQINVEDQVVTKLRNEAKLKDKAVNFEETMN